MGRFPAGKGIQLNRVIGSAPVGLGLATIATLSITAPLVSGTHTAVYHLDGSALAIFLPVAFDYFCVAALLVVLLHWAERSASRLRVVWTVLIAVMPVVLLKNWGSMTAETLPRVAFFVAALIPLLLLAAVSVWWNRGGARVFDLAQELFAYAFGMASLFGLLVALQLAWFGWEARDLNHSLELHRHTARIEAGPPHGRVIWILLDELSYQELYGQRYRGLNLPAFDRLASEGTVFTHVVPVAEDTALVIPSLMTGIWTNELGITGDGQLHRLHDASTGHWESFDPYQTVFQDALSQGYSTGVAGWYNPYCRILPSVLDHCVWGSRMPLHGHMYSERSAMRNIIGPWTSLITTTQHLLLGQSGNLNPDVERTMNHIADYRQLVAAGDDLLQDSSSDFIFLHMPFPHPGGIFDRKQNRLTVARSSYIDNLALADEYMAHVRALLERRGEWDSSTVVVMGDHPWRTKLIWRGTPEWTAEDELASHGGQFDDRPAYLVKLPGQRSGATIDSQYKAIRTRGLMDEFFTGQIKSVEELQAWVRAGGG